MLEVTQLVSDGAGAEAGGSCLARAPSAQPPPGAGSWLGARQDEGASLPLGLSLLSCSLVSWRPLRSQNGAGVHVEPLVGLQGLCRADGMCVLSRVRLSATPRPQPPRLLCPWDSPGKNTGVGCHFLLHGIFATQGWNPRHHCTTLPSPYFLISSNLEVFPRKNKSPSLFS